MQIEADSLGSMPFNPCEGHNGAVASKRFPERAPRDAGRAECCPNLSIHLLA